jgi:hypothetical protein
MYLRYTTRNKNGKSHVYWRLVRSVRHGRKVVQETVAQLGELDAQGRARARALARGIMGETAVTAQGHLFEANDLLDAVPVKLGKVRPGALARFRGGVVGLAAVAGAEAR